VVLAVQNIGSDGKVLPGGVAANASTNATTQILPVKILDNSGNAITSFGSQQVGALVSGTCNTIEDNRTPTEIYSSPSDFAAAYSTSNSVEIKNPSYTPTVGQIHGVWQVPLGGKVVHYDPSQYVFGYTDLTTSGVISITGASFSATDTFIVQLSGQKKGYKNNTNSFDMNEVSPLNNAVIDDPLVDTTNVAEGVNYYPSSDGIAMLGSAAFSINGKIIDADDTSYLAVEGSNDEDAVASNREWSRLFGYDHNTGTTVSGIAIASTTMPFFWCFDQSTHLNAKYVRVVATMGDSTNTVIIKSRRTAL
jgi:hypothetical protein